MPTWASRDKRELASPDAPSRCPDLTGPLRVGPVERDHVACHLVSASRDRPVTQCQPEIAAIEFEGQMTIVPRVVLIWVAGVLKKLTPSEVDLPPSVKRGGRGGFRQARRVLPESPSAVLHSVDRG